MKKDKSKYLFFSIFTFVGLGLLIGGVIVTISHAKYMKTAEPIVAVISDIESYRGAKGKSHYNVYVDYQYDGVMYEHIELNYYSTGMRRGQSLDLYCNRNNPENIRATGADYILQIVLFSIGGVFFLVGFIIGMITIKKDKLRKNLLQNGRPLVAIVEQIDFDYSYSVNRRHPYVIYCTYNNSIIDVTYRFKSEHVWGDPERYYPVGSEIIVMVDPNDYSKYYVKVENNERDYN